MPPKLNGIDHIHLYVPDRRQAAQWYQEALGFHIVDSMAFWARDDRGPLTIADASGAIHLALFRKDDFTPSTAIAFRATGDQFLDWKAYLEEKNLLDRLSDHSIAWSMYFRDPYGNVHEITTMDYDLVAQTLK